MKKFTIKDDNIRKSEEDFEEDADVEEDEEIEEDESNDDDVESESDFLILSQVCYRFQI